MVYGWGSVPWDGGDPANFYPLGAPDNHTPKILYIIFQQQNSKFFE